MSALTAAELEAIGISTLADALAVLPRRAFIDVELKDAPTHTTVEVLAAGRGPDLARAVVSSFDVAALSRIRALAPAWDRWLNVEAITGEAIGLALGLQCAAIAAEWHAIDERSAAAVRGAGLSLAAWTVRRRPSARRLARLGVVAMCVEGRALGPWASIAGQAGRDA